MSLCMCRPIFVGGQPLANNMICLINLTKIEFDIKKIDLVTIQLYKTDLQVYIHLSTIIWLHL